MQTETCEVKSGDTGSSVVFHRGLVSRICPHTEAALVCLSKKKNPHLQIFTSSNRIHRSSHRGNCHPPSARWLPFPLTKLTESETEHWRVLTQAMSSKLLGPRNLNVPQLPQFFQEFQVQLFKRCLNLVQPVKVLNLTISEIIRLLILISWPPLEGQLKTCPKQMVGELHVDQHQWPSC